MNLEQLTQRADIWRGGNTPPEESRTAGLSTGIPGLETILPGGWPQGALTEILIPDEGIGELGLVMPALARLSCSKRWLAWVAPPHIPYAPALVSAGVDLSRVMVVRPRASADGLWAVEQTLRAGTCGAVLAWLSRVDTVVMRRLQLAAEAGNSWGVVFRPLGMASQSSPAALRLKLESTPHGLAVHVLKRRGGWATGPVYLNEH
ncbi:MAG: translesion DNA synthesis-associated protein ImuA [Acidiferrobacterales bacterium]